MNLNAILAAIPGMTPAQRRVLRANAERLLRNGTESQKAAARTVIEALDAQAEKECARQAEEIASIPLSARVAKAFRTLPPTEAEAKVLRALLANPGTSSADLSRACGWRAQSWHMHFGKTAERREALLWPAEPSRRRDANFYCGILADFDPDGSLFTMKPDVVAGLAEVGIAVRGEG